MFCSATNKPYLWDMQFIDSFLVICVHDYLCSSNAVGHGLFKMKSKTENWFKNDLDAD